MQPIGIEYCLKFTSTNSCQLVNQFSINNLTFNDLLRMQMQGKGKYLILILCGFLSFEAFGYEAAGIRFIENLGQWDKKVFYKAAIPGGDLYILKNKLKYVFYRKGQRGHEGLYDENESALRLGVSPSNKNLIHSVELSFQGANDYSEIVSKNAFPEMLNFIKGTDEQHWATGVTSYSELIIDEIYAGIDFRLYFSSGGMKYDFIVSPGADPSQIQMKYEGQNELKIHEGKIIVGTVHGYFFENVPVSYSESSSRKKSVLTEFELDKDIIRFNFPHGYDTSTQLVIDPELIFSTYSGSYADNWGFTATYDDHGNLYSGGKIGRAHV